MLTRCSWSIQRRELAMAETHREKVRRLYRERKAKAEKRARKWMRAVLRRIAGSDRTTK